MTKQEVLELIARYIIKNDNGEITATVLQPILEQMVLQPNILIGRLELLNTSEKDSLVNAINSIVSMNIDELVEMVNVLVENNIEQDEKILVIETEVKRLELEKADKTEIPDVSNLVTQIQFTDGLDLKADLTYVNEELYTKADISAIPDTSGLATKIELTDGLDLKANKLDVDADLLQINTEIGQVEQSLSTKIGDAPSDGKQYARQDEEWSEVIAGGGGSLVKVDLADGTVAYKLDSNDLAPTTSSIDLRAGNQTEQLGDYAVCVSAELPEGYGNTAEGSISTVSGGAINTASGDTSTVSGGQSNTAEGDGSTVSGGLYNTASGLYSTVLGGNTNTASGGNSTVLGGNTNTASGLASTVLGGQRNTAEGNISTVSGGTDNIATNYSETVVGMYSDNTGTPQQNRVEGSPIFRVGIGTANNRRDGFIVTNRGNLKLPEADTGIELTSPNGTAYRLSVRNDGELVITAV